MRLEIKYGINFEVQRVENALVKLDGYLTQGYEVRLPGSVSKSTSLNTIQEQVEKEYAEKDYKETMEKFLVDFLTIEKQFSERLKTIFDIEIPVSFVVYLTKYGVGGSYNPPNVVIFNIYNKKGFKTIIHEITHLIIEPWIQKYGIQHWEKERIVDLILNSKEFCFLKYDTWQNNYDSSEKYIDGLFNEYFFENIEKFFSEIQGRRISVGYCKNMKNNN